jgi:hypothetical protein
MAMIVVVLVGVVSLAGLGVLSAYAPELKKGDDGGAHALSRSSVGYAATVRLLRETGRGALVGRGPLAASTEEGLLVLTPAVGAGAVNLEDFDHPGPQLIVLPKWATAPDPSRKGWALATRIVDGKASLTVLPDDLRKGLTLRAPPPEVAPLRLYRPNGQLFGLQPSVRAPRSLEGKGWTPVLKDEDGRMVLAMHTDSQTYVLAEPDLLNTSALKTLEGARTAVALLDLIHAKDTPVVFDATLHGFARSRSLLRLLLEPPLVGATLVLVALAVLAALQAGVRFGPALKPRRAVALGKLALADNTAGLIRLAGREARMTPLYAQLIRASVARAIGAPRGMDDPALDAFLDRVSLTVGASSTFTALAERARAASASDMMPVARDLHLWKQELIRGRQ